MIKVAVYCCAGMSTSLLVQKIKNEAESRRIEIDIEAYPESSMKYHSDIDCALLGPQIIYLKEKAETMFTPLGITFEVINSVDYGMMNGKKILDLIISLTNK